MIKALFTISLLIVLTAFFIVDGGDPVKRLQEQAESGAAAAQYMLGDKYETGDGIKQDDTASIGWYRKAAEQGWSPAQSRLGYFYHEGKGVDKDNAEAVFWLRRLA